MYAVDLIKESINEISIKTALERYGATHIRILGNTIRCTCPFHEGKNDTAFSWNIETKLWCCFSENIGGDVFSFIAHAEHLNLEEDFHLIVNKTSDVFGINILGLEIGKIELLQKREVSDWLNYIKHTKYELPTFDLNTLGSFKKMKRYRNLDKKLIDEHMVTFAEDLNRVVFPIQSDDGRIVGASCRANGSVLPKWKHYPAGIKTGNILYNLSFCIIQGFKEVHICEGIVDVINLKRIGVLNAVCTFGCRVTKEQSLLLMKYFETIIVAFDNDVAGINGAKKVIEQYKSIFNIKVLDLIEFNDVGELGDINDYNNINIVRWWEYER